MCIIGVSVGESESFPFVLCSNRDEYTNRPSKQAEIKNKILCGTDNVSKGTWMGLNCETGVFSALTNIGTYPSTKSRGTLIKNILEKNEIQQEMEKKNDYPGFNLISGNIFEKEIVLEYNSNKLISKKSENFSKTSLVLANDLVGDEFVKSPYLRNKMNSILEEKNKSIYELRDKLGNLMSEQQCNPLSSFGDFFGFFSKFFKYGGNRRVQPAMTMFYYLTLISCLFVLYSGFLFLILILISFCISIHHHWCKQNLFVKLNYPGKYKFGTVSQTIIISNQKSIFYFYRDCFDRKMNQWSFGNWKEFKVEIKNLKK
jgi:uncharacterized protein with NRDE domain